MIVPFECVEPQTYHQYAIENERKKERISDEDDDDPNRANNNNHNIMKNNDNASLRKDSIKKSLKWCCDSPPFRFFVYLAHIWNLWHITTIPFCILHQTHKSIRMLFFNSILFAYSKQFRAANAQAHQRMHLFFFVCLKNVANLSSPTFVCMRSNVTLGSTSYIISKCSHSQSYS